MVPGTPQFNIFNSLGLDLDQLRSLLNQALDHSCILLSLYPNWPIMFNNLKDNLGSMTQEPYGNQWKSPAALGISLNNGTNGLLFGLTVTRAGSQHCVCQVRKLLGAPVSMWGMWSQVGVYRTNDFAVDFREISHGDKLFDPKCRDFLWILPAINSLRLTDWWTSHLQKFTNMTCSQWGIIWFLRDESDETKEICHTNNYPLFADAKESLSRIKINIISAYFSIKK